MLATIKPAATATTQIVHAEAIQDGKKKKTTQDTALES